MASIRSPPERSKCFNNGCMRRQTTACRSAPACTGPQQRVPLGPGDRSPATQDVRRHSEAPQQRSHTRQHATRRRLPASEVANCVRARSTCSGRSGGSRLPNHRNEPHYHRRQIIADAMKCRSGAARLGVMPAFCRVVMCAADHLSLTAPSDSRPSAGADRNGIRWRRERRRENRTRPAVDRRGRCTRHRDHPGGRHRGVGDPDDVHLDRGLHPRQLPAVKRRRRLTPAALRRVVRALWVALQRVRPYDKASSDFPFS
jgi:hypothetical protein